MERLKSITFDKKAQDELPQSVKDKMQADRKEAEAKQLLLTSIKTEFKKMDYKKIQILLLKHIEVLNEEKMITGIPTIKITNIAKELEKALKIGGNVTSVLCVDSKHIANLRQGAEYKIIAETEEYYGVINDLGILSGYCKWRFKKH